MEQVATLAIVFFSAVMLLLPFEASNLHKRATSDNLAITRFQSFRIALFSISISFALAILGFLLVLFGPAYALGDLTALPWLTAIPALIAGFWIARHTSNKLVSSAFRRLGRAG